MNEDPKVDYAEVRDDFEFFLAHSTETAAQISAMVPHLGWLSSHQPSPRFVDFGCGTGDFTAQLLGALAPPPHNLNLYLVEPVAEHRQKAERALQPYAEELTRSVADLAALEASGFDLILANHSLYYLTAAEVADLADRIAANGMLMAAMQHSGNALAKIWLKACELSGQPFPFIFADDVERIFRERGLPYDREMVPYRIEFPDTGENRYRVLHFLFGTYLDAIPKEKALTFFDPYAHAGSIRIDTAYPHLIARHR